MNAQIKDLAAEVAQDGLSFSNDRAALLAIMNGLHNEVQGVPAEVEHAYLVASLRVLDAKYGWTTPKVNTRETDAARQVREDNVYQMLATIYLMSLGGARVNITPRGI